MEEALNLSSDRLLADDDDLRNETVHFVGYEACLSALRQKLVSFCSGIKMYLNFLKIFVFFSLESRVPSCDDFFIF